MSLVNASRSEVTKQFTTAMWWILGVVLLAYVGVTAGGLGATFGALASGALPAGATNGPTLAAEVVPPLVYSLATSVGYVFPLLIGTLLVTNEFRHKTLTPTFLATPRRGVALGGKLVAGVIMGVLYAAVAIVAAVGVGGATLALVGVDTRLGEGHTWAMIARMTIAFVLWTLVGVGIGTLVRNQVAAVVGVLAFTQFVEPIARTVAGFVDGVSAVTTYLPGAASDALVGASVYTSIGGATSTLSWWAGGLVLLAYAGVLLALGYATSWRRDVG